MKYKHIYLLPLAIMLAAGCIKGNNGTSNPVIVPVGTFSGQFMILHKNKTTTKVDTTKSNITLSLSSSYTYAVSGDTTLHAASFGSYALNAYYMQFNDLSLTGAGISHKVHLNDLYDYQFDGTNLQIGHAYGDTLTYLYYLKK